MESKILVVGCKKTGKTTLLESLDGHLDENTNNYVVDFQTREDGNVRFICTETSNTGITRHWDYNGFVVIFDLTNVPSYKVAKTMCRELRMFSDKPIALVGNKDDLPIAVHDIASHKQYKVQLFSVSAMEKTDVEKPFLYLAQSIVKKPSLTFTVITSDGENIAANADEANVNAENDDEMTVNAHSANDSNVNANPDAADSILGNSTCTASIPKTPTNNTRDFAGESLASNSAGVLETTPGRSTRRRQQLLRISGKDEVPNFIRINGKDEVPNFINNERPTCCYLN